MENSIDQDSLIEFIWEAQQNTYAAPAEIRVLHRAGTPMLSGFVDYVFIDGAWIYPDSYA